MDFDLDRVLDVENIIRAIFHGEQIFDACQVPNPPLYQAQLPVPATPVTPSALSTSASSSTSAAASISTCTTASSAPAPATAPAPAPTPTPSLALAPIPKTKPKPRSKPNPRSKAKPASPRKSASAASSQSPPSVHPAQYGQPSPVCGDSSRPERESSVDVDLSNCLLLPPDLDMSSAIALSQKLVNNGKRTYTSAFGHDDDHAYRPYESAFRVEDNVSYYPRQYMSMEEACSIPPRPLRDELVRLYFVHFHPFCPVVNELDFMDIYDTIEDDELFKKSVNLTLFQAMMFVAIGHLPLLHLRNTPYKSIPEGQKALFDKASVLYHMNYTLDQLELTKVTLLFTYWHPFDSESRVNNYWVDRAFHHARAIRLWDAKYDNEDTTGRRRIIWWCCLLRDRLVSIALRRAYRIQEAKVSWAVVDVNDFGLEVMFPKFVDVKAKRAAIEAFIWLCKLSDIIRDVAVFHERNSFHRTWSGSRIDKAALMPELNQVSQFDCRLKNWKEGYLKVNGDYIRSPKPNTCKMPNYVQIINDSALASLYLPYIHCPPGSIQIVQGFQRVALSRVKSAASMVALRVRKLNATGVVGEEIAVGIIGWVALPMAVFKVLSDINGSVSQEPHAGRYSDFVPFMTSLAARFHAAKVLLDMMGETSSDLVERSVSLGIARVPRQAQVAGAIPIPGMGYADGKGYGYGNGYAPGHGHPRTKDVEEAEMLDCVAKMVDLRLSANAAK